MQSYLLQHIEALITTGLGLFMTLHVYRNRARYAGSSSGFRRAMPILAPLVLAWGLAQFVFDPSPRSSWRHVATNDGVASAEFPVEPRFREATDMMGDVSVRRFTHDCDLPGRDVNLRLSYNEIPPAGRGLTPDERLEGLREYFQQQGFHISSVYAERFGALRGFRFVMEQPDEKSKMITRIAITPGAIYRVVATSAAGFHGEPAIARFVESFSISEEIPAGGSP